MVGRMPCTLPGHASGGAGWSPPHHCGWVALQCCGAGAELLPGWRSRKAVKKCRGTAQNNIYWVTSGSGRQGSLGQKGDKKMQHGELVFASRMEETEDGYRGQGWCQDSGCWCCCHQFILGFRQII